MDDIQFRRFTQNSCSEQQDTRPTRPNKFLEDGLYLPLELENRVPENLILVPLEEIDKFYTSTFIVIDSDYRLHRYSADKSLFIFDAFSELRLLAIKTENNFWFRSILACATLILLVFTLLLSEGYLLHEFDIVLSLIGLELVVRVIAQGLVLHPFSCLRKPLNVGDLLTLVAGVIHRFMIGVEVLAVMFRFLRLPDMWNSRNVRQITYSLYNSIKSSGTAILFFVLLTFCSALLGMNFFKGDLRQMCASRDPKTGEFLVHFDESFMPVLCRLSDSSYYCPKDYTCIKHEFVSVDYGLTSYDYFGWSILSTLRVVMLDYIENLYVMLFTTSGILSLVYFFPLVFFGSMFFLGLFSVIVYLSYNDACKIFREQNTSTNSVSNENGNILKSCWSCTCLPPLVPHRETLRSFILNPYVELFFKFCILLNVIPLLFVEDMVKQYYADFEGGMLAATSVIFVFEVVLKLIALSPSTYFRSGWNTFDFVVLLCLFLDFGVSLGESIGAAMPMRVLKLLSVLTYFNFYIRVIGTCTSKLFALVQPLIAVVVTAAIIGYALFEFYYRKNTHLMDGGMPRRHFADLGNSWLYAFEILGGEWIELFWTCSMYAGVVGCFVYHSLFAFFGRYILQCVFQAVLIGSIRHHKEAPLEDVPADVEVLLRLTSRFRSQKRGPQNANDVEARPVLPNDPAKEEERRDSVVPLADVIPEPPSTVKQIVDSNYFEYFIMTVITISFVVIVIEYQTESNTVFHVCRLVDLIVGLIYLVELTMRLMAYRWKYFNSFSNIVDLFVALLLPLQFFFFAIDVIRVVRIFRMFKLLSFDLNMQVITQTFISSFQAISKASISIIIAWFMYAVIGVQGFHDQFYRCVDTLGLNVTIGQVSSKDECLAHNLTWIKHTVNFDSLVDSYWALLHLASLKGHLWIQELAAETKPHAIIFQVIFFSTFTVVGSFLTFRLLSAIVITRYQEHRRQLLKKSLEQIVNERLERFIQSETLLRPKDPLEQTLFDILLSKYYDMVMQVVIFASIMIMSLNGYQHEGKSYYGTINDWMVTIFAFDSIAKVVTLKVEIFKRPWFVFDVIVLVLQLFGMVGFIFGGGTNDFDPGVFRTLHLFRIFLLYLPASARANFRRIIVTFKSSVPMLLRTYLLLFAITAVYAVFGVDFFAHIKDKAFMTKDLDFSSFWGSFLLLWPAGTSAGWDGLVRATMDTADCKPDEWRFEKRGNCGHPLLGQIYFFTYIVFVYIIVYNIAIAVVFDAYEELTQEEEVYGMDDLFVENFVGVWRRHDPNDKGVINSADLPKLLEELQNPVPLPSEEEQPDMKSGDGIVFSHVKVLCYIATAFSRKERATAEVQLENGNTIPS